MELYTGMLLNLGYNAASFHTRIVQYLSSEEQVYDEHSYMMAVRCTPSMTTPRSKGFKHYADCTPHSMDFKQ